MHITADYAKNAMHGIKLAEEALTFQKEHGSPDYIIAAKEKELNKNNTHAENLFLTVKAFVEGGVDADEKNNYGQTARDIAVKSGAKK